MNTVKETINSCLGLVLSKWSLLDDKIHLSSDLYLIQYVIRRILLHTYNLVKTRNSYWYLFESQVKAHPNTLALIFPRPLNNGFKDEKGFEVEQYTYQELYDIVLRLSNVLVHRYGIQADETVGINYTNKPFFIFIWLALWNIGAIPAFLNYNNVGKPLVHCVSIANMKHVLVDPDVVSNVQESEKEIKDANPDVQLHYLDDTSLFNEITDENTLKFRQDDSKRCPNDSDYSTAALIYTSGTTGLPKSAIMSWRKAGLGSSLYGFIVHISQTSRVFTSMPLYHSTASILGVCATFSQGGAIVLSTKFSTSTIWTQIKITDSTHLQYVGEVCRYLLNSKPHPDENNHKLQVAYGNGLRSDIWKEFKNRFKINAIGEFYAATESPIALTSFQVGDYGIGACRNYGKLINFILQYQQTIIKMDPEDQSIEWRDPKTGFCKVTDIGEPGELIMNLFFAKDPKKVFQGYLGNKKETDSKIIKNVFKKGDAWYRSGDLLKQDENGLWYFVDRLGDTFRWKSENVSATEVENQILLVPGVHQVVIVGVKVPNHEGRAGFAVIEIKKNSTEIEILEKLLKFIELPKYAIPIFIKFVDKIKGTDNYKIPKKKFRNQILPAGENGDEVIYWLKNGQYVQLSSKDWDTVIKGQAKI